MIVRSGPWQSRRTRLVQSTSDDSSKDLQSQMIWMYAWLGYPSLVYLVSFQPFHTTVHSYTSFDCSHGFCSISLSPAIGSIHQFTFYHLLSLLSLLCLPFWPSPCQPTNQLQARSLSWTRFFAPNRLHCHGWSIWWRHVWNQICQMYCTVSCSRLPALNCDSPIIKSFWK